MFLIHCAFALCRGIKKVRLQRRTHSKNANFLVATQFSTKTNTQITCQVEIALLPYLIWTSEKSKAKKHPKKRIRKLVDLIVWRRHFNTLKRICQGIEQKMAITGGRWR